jgi:predicted dehydrogenase
MQILEASKHIYNEKPLAIALEDAQHMMAPATSKGLRIGWAPYTFPGG